MSIDFLRDYEEVPMIWMIFYYSFGIVSWRKYQCS